MKSSRYALMLALCTSPIWAEAHGDGPSSGKTTAQARADLEKAWQDGLLPHNDKDYPPSAASIERNKKRYAGAHPETDAADASAQTDTSPAFGK
ncbi:hypothetical protein AWB79_01869 [Caballeronia hypogeia]|uniref:Purine nucleoside phosphorylase n=1 Tax=Caballeronia hypogeia TaxID=1777140 RepID=A0A158A3F2_9BURK|nr:DUF4148 domain-containing protein [Caballeronia hypogeia]SAK52351.1 hypothetical protein AWB79_01869 [Caballeronia hypogeia]